MTEDLKIFFNKTYQLQKAISYLAVMLGDNDVLQLDYLKKGGVGSLSAILSTFSTIFLQVTPTIISRNF